MLERLGRLSLREQSMEGLLQTVADLAASVMPGHARASATLPVRDRPTTVASTGPLATDLDERQYDRDHDPCLHAARTGELVEITDTRTDPRWPDYTLRAAEHGAPSSLSVPLDIDADGEVTGGLDIYAREPHAVDEDSRAAAMGSAPSAAVAAGNLHAYRTARDEADDLGTALETRAVIDRAKGILEERHEITADQAFQALAQVSVRTNRKLRAVADDLVLTGEAPAGEEVGTGDPDRPGRAPGRPATGPTGD